MPVRLEVIRILLVDDDCDFCAAACMELEDLGFIATGIHSGEAMFRYLGEGGEADVIVLDWKMPGVAGLEYLKPLRERQIETPVIFFTGVPATAYETAALDNGAIDFVDKSRGLPILARRIRRLLKSVCPPESARPASVIRHRGLILRPEIRRAYWHGQDANLTITEYNIVSFMVAQAGSHVTYRAIYDCVRSAGFAAGAGEEGYRTNVRSTVKRIRKKFRSLDPEFAEIENFSAFGYRWR
jgi:two-component system response regulator ChvI